MGSSPLARGLRWGARFRPGVHRIIPARAGFTARRGDGRWLGEDHPRSRGVYGWAVAHTVIPAGSSPLARGLPGSSPTGRRCTRIIPARAGFTIPLTQKGKVMTDHPRSRGVYSPGRSPLVRRPGSSPLARGLLDGRQVDARLPGIIPARAGFTAPAQEALPPGRDHPRSRGVYGLRDDLRAAAAGSSPLARGLRWVPASWSHARGIIPARAGFTGVGRRPPRGGRDHPRSRGVYRPAAMAVWRFMGSSPLARGLQL